MNYEQNNTLFDHELMSKEMCVRIYVFVPDEQSEEKKDLTKEIAQLSRQMKQGFKGMKHGFKGMKQGFKGTADQMKQGFTAAADQTEAVGLAVYNIVLTKSPDLSTGVDVKPTNKHKSHK